MKPEPAALASGRRPGIPESGSGTTAADGGPPGPAPTQPGCWPRSAGSVTLASPGSSPPWTPRGALDPGLDSSEAADMVYALLSPDVHKILTVERGWTADRHERWIARAPAHSCAPATDRQQARTRPPDQAAPVRSDQTHPLTERRTGGQNGLSVRPHRQACRSQRACIGRLLARWPRPARITERKPVPGETPRRAPARARVRCCRPGRWRCPDSPSCG